MIFLRHILYYRVQVTKVSKLQFVQFRKVVTLYNRLWTFLCSLHKKFSFISTPPSFLMAQAAICSLFIINKSGGLIYYKVYSWFPYLFFYICKYEEPAHFSRIMVQLGGWTPMTVLDWQVSGIQCMLSPNNSPLSLVVLALTSYKPITSIFTASNPSQVCKLLYS